MPTLRLETHLSSEELLQAVQQLDLPELERFVGNVVALRAQRQAPCLSQSEAELLQKINQGLSQEQQGRWQALAAKRDAETLTPDEHAELLQLTETLEQLQARRVEALLALAQLRKKTLAEVMNDLGLGVPADG